jgi:hypothetical protein
MLPIPDANLKRFDAILEKRDVASALASRGRGLCREIRFAGMGHV